jgi:hypothetical protein
MGFLEGGPLFGAFQEISKAYDIASLRNSIYSFDDCLVHLLGAGRHAGRHAGRVRGRANGWLYVLSIVLYCWSIVLSIVLYCWSIVLSIVALGGAGRLMGGQWVVSI